MLVPPLLAGSMTQMAVIMFVAGLPIAPSVAIAYNLIERAAVAGTQAEVFGWLSTAVTAGIAVGTAGGGSLIAHGSVHRALCARASSAPRSAARSRSPATDPGPVPAEAGTVPVA